MKMEKLPLHRLSLWFLWRLKIFLRSSYFIVLNWKYKSMFLSFFLFSFSCFSHLTIHCSQFSDFNNSTFQGFALKTCCLSPCKSLTWVAFMILWWRICQIFNYKVLFSRTFTSSLNSSRDIWMILLGFPIFDRIFQGFCELLRYFTGASLALWCKLTAYNSRNCNLSTENQYGITFDTVLNSNFFSYEWWFFGSSLRKM